MLKNLLEKINEEYTLKSIENDEFSSVKISIMHCDCEIYEAKNLGHVFYMNSKAPLGLMKMETLIINPFELDAPLLSFELINNKTILFECYNTLLEEDFDSSKLQAVCEKYKEYKLENTPHWYDELLLAFIKAKMSNNELIKQFVDESFKTYLDVLEDSHICDPIEKKAKAKEFTDGLLENGGPSTDMFMKKFGLEKTEKFFNEAMFGTK